MKIAIQSNDDVCEEHSVYEQLLALDDTHILELGCGKADITRKIATAGSGRVVTATEVDMIQHQLNLQIKDLPNVTFKLGGSEAIPADDEVFDYVFMFKSLHHVPINLMDKSLEEIRRVLKPGGKVYISEPVFAGDFNEVLRLFHDEEEVRMCAFSAIQKSLEKKLFTQIDELYFNTVSLFDSFADFENRVINVTHTSHKLSEQLNQKVKARFELNYRDGKAMFLIPNRVNLLQKQVLKRTSTYSN